MTYLVRFYKGWLTSMRTGHAAIQGVPPIAPLTTTEEIGQRIDASFSFMMLDVTFRFWRSALEWVFRVYKEGVHPMRHGP